MQIPRHARRAAFAAVAALALTALAAAPAQAANDQLDPDTRLWINPKSTTVQAAQALGADPAATAMAVQIGDQWTNMVQPFWLLPVLAISGLKLRDVMGYMVLILGLLGVIFATTVLVWGFALA
jgi:short subunit fatty acids transporter